MTLAAGSFTGAPVRRVEDLPLIQGQGTYVDNLKLPGTAVVHFIRSSVARARIVSIDTTGAQDMPGVLGVYTAADLDLPPAPSLVVLRPDIPKPCLAVDVVNYVGDPIVAVVAESRAQAVDAAELVEIDYDPLPPVVDMEEALASDAPVLYEAAGSNLMVGARTGAEDALDDAEVVVRGRFVNQRLAVVPMEGSAILVDPTAEGYDLTVYCACQMPHTVRTAMAAAFEIDPERLRVIAPNVGGSFGGKHVTGEGYVVTRIAQALGRPVKWVETRSENLVSMPHGRAQVQYVELGLRRDGTITGLQCRMISDTGAYAGFGGVLLMGQTKTMAQGVYRIPKIAFDVAIATTNTTPTGPYRGAGRPEAAYLLERILDMAADELDIDPTEIRRRNFVQPDEFPYQTVQGPVYDSGDYERALDEALRLADYEGLRDEQAARRDRADGTLLGIGVSSYVEITLGGSEFAEVEVHTDGRVTVKAGTSAHGQGHATTFTQIVADQLGIPMEQITYVQSDTALVDHGFGTGGSRSVQLGGSSVRQTSRQVVERARAIVADLLEASPEDVVVDGLGGLGVAGVPSRSVSWAEVATAAAERGDPLLVQHDSEWADSTFPFGSHVAVVEVDTDTGRVTLRQHIAVEDCGVVINPLLADGQVHGGIASGVAQALWEQVVYDEDGNPLTSTLADYTMPSAAELPSYTTAFTETPSPNNELGAKGIGESATVGSTPAVVNAVVDALSHLGVRHIDMPCTPERVWRAIEDARAGRLADPWREPPAAMAELPRNAPMGAFSLRERLEADRAAAAESAI